MKARTLKRGERREIVCSIESVGCVEKHRRCPAGRIPCAYPPSQFLNEFKKA
jgi:hypothetical protein